MRIDVRANRGICVVEATGRLVIGTGELLLRDRLDKLIADGERRFVLHLAGLEQIDSAGVGELVFCHKRAAETGAVLKVAVGAEGIVRRVFELSGLERAFEVFDDEDSAVASFA